jgi:hypothetical protein
VGDAEVVHNLDDTWHNYREDAEDAEDGGGEEASEVEVEGGHLRDLSWALREEGKPEDLRKKQIATSLSFVSKLRSEKKIL